jgi:hypothetical protein
MNVFRTIGLLPLLFRAMESNHGSWTHPYGSVHRALVFFSQGYNVSLDPRPQLCWAAGIDSLYASKIDRRLQGGRELSRRLQAVFGPDFEPYGAPTVLVPGHQGSTAPETKRHWSFGLGTPTCTAQLFPTRLGFQTDRLDQSLVTRTNLWNVARYCSESLFSDFWRPSRL